MNTSARCASGILNHQCTCSGTVRWQGRSGLQRQDGTAALLLLQPPGQRATDRRCSGHTSSTTHTPSIRKESGRSPCSSHGKFGSSETVEFFTRRSLRPGLSSRQCEDPWRLGDWRERNICSPLLGTQRERSSKFRLRGLALVSFLFFFSPQTASAAV